MVSKYIVSFPRSGRTWLSILLGKALCERYRIMTRDYADLQTITERISSEPVVLDHAYHHHVDCRDYRWDHRFDGSKILFLMRDPRDTIVSFYHFAKDRVGAFEGDLDTFVDEKFELLLRYLWVWVTQAPKHAEVKILNYEEMLTRPAVAVRGVDTWFGLGLDWGAIENAVEFASFSNLRRLEDTGAMNSDFVPRHSGSEQSRMFRLGKARSFVDEMGPDVRARCTAMVGIWHYKKHLFDLNPTKTSSTNGEANAPDGLLGS